jgi:2-hydroxy-3-oxopropionate reductase
MGAAVARRLLSTGHEVTVWNRSARRAEPLVSEGARPAGSAAELGGCEIVVTALTDGPAMSDLLESGGLAQALRPGSMLIDISSIAPDEARAHSGMLGARGVHHLDAPVSGGPQGAAAGELAIMVGCDPEALGLAAPMLQHLGRATWVGGPGAGQVAKLANQLMVAANIAGVAEALLLARRGGADPAAVRDAVRGGFAESRVLDLHGARMLAEDFANGGRSGNQLKDLENAARLLRKQESSLPLLDLLRDLYAGLCGNEGPELDHSALILELERRAQASARSSK